MNHARPSPDSPHDSLIRMPDWLRPAPGGSLEEVAFHSGAALAVLHLLLSQDAVPRALLRARLALGAAEATIALTGRPERAPELRDELCLLRPGDLPGPAGAIYQHWMRAVERPLTNTALLRALPELGADQMAVWMDAGQGGPVERMALVLEAVMADAPRAEAAALILADATLARSLGWGHLIPLLAANLKPRALRQTGDELRLACHRAVLASCRDAAQMAADLARRSARLTAVAPKLRAKGAPEAVTVFLTRDAVSPAMLSTLMSGRAARRFCDRLVELGAVRELTGRDSFRLYGV